LAGGRWLLGRGLSEPLEELKQVAWQTSLEEQSFVRLRVLKAEDCGVQCQTRCSAAVGDRGSAERSAIFPVSANRVTGLGQVNANLMRSTGFESAFDERES
jgi:hypothetical protein